MSAFAIETLSSIRINALDQAEMCESTFAMQLRLNLARGLARIIEDLRTGVTDLGNTLNKGWARIELAAQSVSSEETEGLGSLVEELADLGVLVTPIPVTKRDLDQERDLAA